MTDSYNVGIIPLLREIDSDLSQLKRAVFDQEQAVRFFMRRDEMNAEVHLVEGDRASVRYSPITINADRVLNLLWRLLYVEPPESLLP